MHSLPVTLHRLVLADVPLLRKLNALFGDAFAEPEIYTAEPPSDAYLEGLLAKEHVVALAALAGEEVLGGLVDYGDDPAIALYGKLGTREDVLHFDIGVGPTLSHSKR